MHDALHCSPKTPLHRNTQNTESFESTIDAEHFELRSSNYSLRNANNLAHFRPNQTTFGSKSLKCIGPQIWNGLPNELKSAKSLKSF